MTAFPPGEHWARNVRPVGYCDLDAKPGFKLAIHQAAGRWFLYVAHLWQPGWSIVEVTDPARPGVAKFIDGPANTWTIQVQVAGERMITSLERIAPGWGGDAEKPFAESVLIWDLKDPQAPVQLGQYRAGGGGTHRNYYDGGRFVHLSLQRPGYAGQIYEIIDIEDPADPREVARWWVPGQWTEGGEEGAPPFTMLHGGPHVAGDRVYLPYGAAGLVIMDISDIAQPSLVGRLRFAPPFNPFVGVHSAVPIPSRDLVVVNSEAIKENCEEPLNFTGLVDISVETEPRLISLFPLPVPPPNSGLRNFAQLGGRFGPHNQHQDQNQPALFKSDHLIFMTYFNAGLRIFDISDSLLPVEVGYFVPPPPARRRGPLPSKLVAQSEDVLVDARGYIYISDKNHGIYILRAEDHLYH